MNLRFSQVLFHDMQKLLRFYMFDGSNLTPIDMHSLILRFWLPSQGTLISSYSATLILSVSAPQALIQSLSVLFFLKTAADLEQIRGEAGVLDFKWYDGEVVISQKLDLSGAAPTETHLAAWDYFRHAALFGKLIPVNPATKTVNKNASKVKNQPAYGLAEVDFLNEPLVGELDLSDYGVMATTTQVSCEV